MRISAIELISTDNCCPRILKLLKQVVLSEKPPIAGGNQGLSPVLLDILISDIGTLVSVYHKSTEKFITDKKYDADNTAKALHKQKYLDDYGEEDVNAPPENIKQATVYTEDNEIGNSLDLNWSNEAAPVSFSKSYNAPGNVVSLNVATSGDDITKLFGSPPSSTPDSFNPGSPHQSNNTVVNQPVLNDAFC